MIADILDQVVRFLDADEVGRLLPVCKSWLKTLHVCAVWRRLCLDPGSSTRLALPSSIPIAELDANQMLSLLICIRSLSSPVLNFIIIKEGIFESSRDDDSQGIDKTLDLRKDSFWSSTGSESQDEGALLVYQLIHGLCVIKKVSITPFRAFYQQGMQCYGPLRARITILLFPEDESSITYRGPWCNLENIEKPFWFDIGREMIIGGAFRVELEGRWSKQPSDQLYYVCLRDVMCYGVPVAAVPNQTFLSALYGLVKKSKGGHLMSYQHFHGLLFDDVESMQNAVKNELTKQRAMLKCRTLINCRRIDGLIETVFPSYYYDLHFRDEVARNVCELDNVCVRTYIDALNDMHVVLTEEESICHGKMTVRSNDIKSFVELVSALRISFSERLGDVFFDAGDYASAMTCYSAAMVSDKVLITCAHLCSKPRTVTYLTILIRTYENGPEAVESIFAILKERHHPHIGCLFLQKMVQQHFIDMRMAARLLEMPSASADLVQAYMKKQQILYNPMINDA